MFKAKIYNLNGQKEVIGYYPEAVPSKEKKLFSNKDKFPKRELTEEERCKATWDRSERRAKTKVRRVCHKFKMIYMWTLTFEKRLVKIKNPTNGRVSTYDVSLLEDAWEVWKLFLQRCRKDGLNFSYIVTVELQEKRLEKYGEKVYHFHFATNKYIPQNKLMALKHNEKHYLNKYWDFGFTKATTSKGKNKMANLYLMKYITKMIKESEKHRQRYRISNNLKVEFEEMLFKDHQEFNVWCRCSGRIINEWFDVMADVLEIWWKMIDT